MTVIHYGSRLKQLIENSHHTGAKISQLMGYAHPKSLWDLYQKEYIKPDILKKALAALKISESDFLNIEITSNASESNIDYDIKPLYIEQRIELSEQRLTDLENQLKILMKQLKTNKSTV